MHPAEGYQPPAFWQEAPLSHAVDLTSQRSLDDELAGLEEYQLYCKAYREGAGKDYNDLRELGAVRRAGNDRHGNPLYLLLPGNLAPDTDLVRLRRYAFQLMAEHRVAAKPFSLLFVQNNINEHAARLSAWFVVSTYRMLPRPFKRNLCMLGVVHPTVSRVPARARSASHARRSRARASVPPLTRAAPRAVRHRSAQGFVRSCLFLLSPFLADSFWDKLLLIERLDFTDDVLGPRAEQRLAELELPHAYYEHDADLEARANDDAAAMRSGTMYMGGLGMGGMPVGGAFGAGVPPR
jgi:hypothetical protein